MSFEQLTQRKQFKLSLRINEFRISDTVATGDDLQTSFCTSKISFSYAPPTHYFQALATCTVRRRMLGSLTLCSPTLALQRIAKNRNVQKEAERNRKSVYEYFTIREECKTCMVITFASATRHGTFTKKIEGTLTDRSD